MLPQLLWLNLTHPVMPLAELLQLTIQLLETNAQIPFVNLGNPLTISLPQVRPFRIIIDFKHGLFDIKHGLFEFKNGLLDFKHGLLDIKYGLLDFKDGLLEIS